MFKYLSKALQDILSPSVLGFVLKVGVASFAIWVLILGVFWSQFEALIASLIEKIPYIGSWHWFQESGAVLSALLVGYTMIIITISILTSLFSEDLLYKLAKKHYPSLPPKQSGAIHRSIYYTVKASIVFIIAFILLFPLIFIPVIGQFVMLWLWSILLREPTIYDVGGIFGLNEKSLLKKSKKSRLIALIAALFNYIPFLNIFAPLYAQILFMHYILGEKDL